MATFWLDSSYAGYDPDSAIFDSNYYPTEIPEGEVCAFILSNPVLVPGDYVMTYAGSGTMILSGNALITSTSSGRIEFTAGDADNTVFTISATDPGETGDYIRDIKIFAAEFEDAIDNGDIWHPKWLKIVEKAVQIRSMDWTRTNNSEVEDWSERAITTEFSYMRAGVPFEVFFNLCNLIEADPMINIPPRVNDAWSTNCAALAKATLDSARIIYPEYMNEGWNPSFYNHWSWCLEQEVAIFGEGTNNRNFRVMRATQHAKIWTDIYDTDAPTRLRNILGTQTTSDNVTIYITAQIWANAEGDEVADPDFFSGGTPDWIVDDNGTLRVRDWIDPSVYFKRLAVTTYFGAEWVALTDNRNLLLEKIADPNVDTDTWLKEQVLVSIANKKTILQAIKTQMNSAGWDGLIAYEGGQHVFHSFGVGGLSSEEIGTLTGYLTAFVLSPEMAELYIASWNSWQDIEPTMPYMQFVECDDASQYGLWGLFTDLDTITKRARTLFALDLGAKNPPTDGSFVVKCVEAES